MDARLTAEPPRASESNQSPPIGALGRELVRIHQVPGLIALGLAAVVGLSGPLIVLRLVETMAGRGNVIPWIWAAGAVCVASLFAACGVVAFLPPLLLRGDNRKASVVHSWVGAREIRRLFGSTAGAFKIPTTPEAAMLWLEAQPDTPEMRPLRLELLLMTRRFDEARALVALYPRQTAFDEFRIVEAHALIADQETGQPDEAALHEAALRVPAGPDRAEAIASLAVLRARRLVGSGDWRLPLVAARPHIPEGDLAILLRDFGAPIFNKIWPWVVLPLGGLVLLLATAITVFAVL